MHTILALYPEICFTYIAHSHQRFALRYLTYIIRPQPQPYLHLLSLPYVQTILLFSIG